MTYQELAEMTKDKTFPLTGENDANERVIVTKGHNGDLGYYKVSTFQKNDWIRVNCYYEDGTVDETYEK